MTHQLRTDRGEAGPSAGPLGPHSLSRSVGSVPSGLGPRGAPSSRCESEVTCLSEGRSVPGLLLTTRQLLKHIHYFILYFSSRKPARYEQALSRSLSMGHS